MTIEEKLSLLVDKLEKVKVDRTAIIEAIKSKGVEIPDDVLLADIPPYILMISGEEEQVNRVINEILYLMDGISDISSETITFSTGANYNSETLILE